MSHIIELSRDDVELRERTELLLLLNNNILLLLLLLLLLLFLSLFIIIKLIRNYINCYIIIYTSQKIFSYNIFIQIILYCFDII